MDLGERRRRVAEAQDKVLAIEARLKKSEARLKDRREELAAEYYSPEDDYPEEPYEPDFDDYNVEDAVENASIQRDADKASLNKAKSNLDEEQAIFEAENSAQIIRAADEERAGAVQWDRRFHTSLAIGHGAAFAAIVTHAFDHDTSQAAIRYSLAPLLLFGAGLITGGTIPLLLARRGDPTDAKAALDIADRARRNGQAMATISAILFLFGLIASVFGVWGMAYQPTKPAETEAKTVVTRPALPSAPLASTAPPTQTESAGKP